MITFHLSFNKRLHKTHHIVTELKYQSEGLNMYLAESLQIFTKVSTNEQIVNWVPVFLRVLRMVNIHHKTGVAEV